MRLAITSLQSRKVLIPILVAALLLVAFVTMIRPDSKHGVAYFDSVTSVYAKDKIRILGVEVGTIEKVTPAADKVRVDFSYDAKYDLPADVKAAIVSPTLVATRFIQLEPAYTGGPKLADGGVIPLERTASPLEFDDLKSELSRLSTTLGPTGLNQTGALSDFLTVAAENGKGQGTRFNTMVTEVAKALETLSSGRGDIFGTVRNLQVFVSAIAQMDDRVANFNRQLAGISDLLDDNGKELTTAIRSVDRAALLVRGFVQENRPQIARASQRLGELTTTLANSREQLSTVLHAAPNTLTNFLSIFSKRTQSYTGGLMVDNLAAPGQLLCTLIAQATGNTKGGLEACSTYLAPLLDQLGITRIPFGTGGVTGSTNPSQAKPAQPAAPGPSPAPLENLTGSLLNGSLLDLLLPGGNS